MNFFERLFISLILFLSLAATLRAQEKSDWYYIEHKAEILQDIRSLFRKGEYDRVLDMCNLHNELLGEDHQEAAEVERLRLDARKCRELVADIQDRLADNDKEGALSLALSLETINPEDEWVRRAGVGAATDPINEVRPRFFIKGGAGLVGLAQQTTGPAFELGVGMLDIAESRWGAGADIFFCPNLASGMASMFGMDARVVFRVTRAIYPNAGVGFFSCRNKEVTGMNATLGPCFPVGVDFVLGKGFIVSASVCILPEVKVWEQKSASTSGHAYKYLEPSTVAGGLVPRICLGYAF